MGREVTFRASWVRIPQNTEGAARLLAHVAKPTNVTAGMKKFRDLISLLEGERPYANRSRDYVLDAVSGVWAQIRHGIEVGDWFDRMCLKRLEPQVELGRKALGYPRTIAASLAGRDKDTQWKPHLPVAHMAAGFRSTMLSTGRGRYFAAGSIPRSVQVEQITDLLWEDHIWIADAVEAAQGRIVLPRLDGIQIPAITRMFVLTDPISQKSRPESQE